LRDRRRSTHRLPIPLAVPWERFRQRMPNRQARSGPSMCQLDAKPSEKDPEGVPLPEQAAHQLACLVRTVMIVVDQMAQQATPCLSVAPCPIEQTREYRPCPGPVASARPHAIPRACDRPDRTGYRRARCDTRRRHR
jgi:hypothetical protein